MLSRPLDDIRFSGYVFKMKNQAIIFKALAEETRLRVLALLLEGELCVCEIIAALRLPQSTISRHLAYLRKSGWVQGRRQGVWMYYRLNDCDRGLRRGVKPLLEEHLTSDPGHVAALTRLRIFQREQGRKAC
jgi:ArsR family transcriptional regulator